MWDFSSHWAHRAAPSMCVQPCRLPAGMPGAGASAPYKMGTGCSEWLSNREGTFPASTLPSTAAAGHNSPGFLTLWNLTGKFLGRKIGLVGPIPPNFPEKKKKEDPGNYSRFLKCPSSSSWRREWLPTPVSLPGEFQGQGLRSMALRIVGHGWATNGFPFFLFIISDFMISWFHSLYILKILPT